jgi:phage-related protein
MVDGKQLVTRDVYVCHLFNKIKKATTKKDVYRLFLLGLKHLAKIAEGKSTSKER